MSTLLAGDLCKVSEFFQLGEKGKVGGHKSSDSQGSQPGWDGHTQVLSFPSKKKEKKRLKTLPSQLGQDKPVFPLHTDTHLLNHSLTHRCNHLTPPTVGPPEHLYDHQLPNYYLSFFTLSILSSNIITSSYLTFQRAVKMPSM